MKTASVRDRIVGLRRVPASELTANPKNWRRHPKAQARALRTMLDDIGYADALIARETPEGLLLLDGHLRSEVTPDQEVPVLIVDLDDDEADKLLASLDPLSAMAETDPAALAELLAGMDLGSDDLLRHLTGGGGRPPSKTEPDAVPAKPRVAVSQPGDCWLLGPHRLVCGDATHVGIVKRAMDGERADIVWTDPPYGVDYEGRTEDKLTLRNDDADGLEELLRGAFDSAWTVCRPGACWYVAAPAGPNGLVFTRLLTELGIWRQTLVWVKDRFVLGHSDYHYRHEELLYGWTEGDHAVPPMLADYEEAHGSVIYGWKPGEAHQVPPDRRQDTVWEVRRPARNRDHPTQKPVDLIERALRNSSEPGARVLDLFGGSGSTLIAAYGTGRVAHLVELDPRYADVICRRFEEHTGIPPVLESTNEVRSFVEIDG